MNQPEKVLENLTIHGVRYIFVKYVSKFTKLFWILAILTSVCGLCYYNYMLYKKLKSAPDISIRVGQRFIKNIPFPAITFCTPLFAKNNLSQMHKLAKHMRTQTYVPQNLSITEQNYLASNIQACIPIFGKLSVPYTKNRTRNDIVKLMDESFPLIDESIRHCRYKELLNECSSLYNRVLTDRGFCYTFNLLGFNTIFNHDTIGEDFYSYKRSKIAKSMYVFDPLTMEKEKDENETFRWSVDNGYAKNHETDSVPVKAEKGKSVSVNLFLNESDTMNVCLIIGNVFSFYVHLPNEIMLPSHQEHFVEFRKKNDVVLTAISYTATDDLRNLSPKSRGCYFEGEKKLKFFKTYTKALCEFECMTNFTFDLCGCVKFSMPRTNDTPVCEIERSDCYIFTMNLWPDFENAVDRFEATCGCLKTCNDIKYDVKFEKTSTSDNVIIGSDIQSNTKGEVISRISFIFNDFEITEHKEYAAYSLHNFVADVGGLLGFFLGCSILSIIEIIYFVLEICVSKLKNCFGGSIKNGNNRNVVLSTLEENNNSKIFIKTFQRNTNKSFNPPRYYRRSVKGKY